MKGKSELRLPRLIPCLLMPPLAAALFCAVNLTALFDGLISRLWLLFGSDFGLDFVFLLFPLLVLVFGLVPAFLLNRRERRVWTLWSAVFFAVFFALCILVLSRGDADPPYIFLLMWLMTAPGVILCHLLPSWTASAVRALALKRPQ